MKLSRSFSLLLLALIFTSAFLISCGDKDEKKDDPSPKQNGTIKASISYIPKAGSTSCWTHYLDGNLKVELTSKDNGESLGTQYTNGQNANLDFGQFPYGNYQVRVTGKVRELNVCNGSDFSNSNIDTYQVLTLDAATKSVSFYINQ
jgi:hypothetical protein